MSQPSNSAVRGSPTSSAASTASSPTAATGDFVVNLCASTTPMALVKPSAPELARYTFFVSRRREEGRERFRLHMGYFATREEAEQMLQLVRDLYPAAWVGETPGRKLAPNPNLTPRSSAPVTPATVSGRAAPGAAPAPAAPSAAKPVAPPAAATPPAPTAVPTAPASAPAPSPARAAVPAPAPAIAVGAVLPEAASTRGRAALPAMPAMSRAAAPVASQSPPVASRQEGVPPASNVREVIAALGPEGGEATVSMPRLRPPAALPDAAPPVPVAPARRAPTTAAPIAAEPPTVARKPLPAVPQGPATPPVAATPAAPPSATRAAPLAADMTDSQVLRVLEGRAASAQARAAAVAGTAAQDGRDIALLSPQDTQTWRDIKAQIKRDAVVHFAVQLNWSVTPIDLARVPSLAIFNAYTLYKIEGNREGRKWYGLRLGFFSDAVSAKQVAHYVRSEFAQVAVVPVGINEREQAKQIGAIALPAAPPAIRPADDSEHEFKLIDDEPKLPPAAVASATDELPETAVNPARSAATPTRAPASTTRRPNRPRGAPQSLEETLEILGASQLSIDSGRGERVVIDGRARRVDAPTSAFTKLLDRLGEKLRK